MKALTKTEITLHWIVGVGMIGMIALGTYIEQAEARNLMSIHKSIGIALLFFIIFRVVIRLRKGWPESASHDQKWQNRIARAVHWALILGTLSMPLSGMLDSVMSGRGLKMFGLELLGSNLGTNGRPEAINEALAGLAEAVHVGAVNFLIGLIAIHILGAMKHHFVDRDGILRRMLGLSAA